MLLNRITQRVRNDLQRFYDQTFPNPDVSSEEILDFFVGSVGPVLLPFPSSLRLSWVKFYEETNNFVYFRRDSFAALHSALHDEGGGVRVSGITGGGKSYLLAAYVVYLHCLQMRNPKGDDYQHIVYLSSCSAAGVCIHAEFIKALHLTFPNHPAFTDVLLHRNDRFQNVVDEVLGDQNVVFIYDDFDYVLGADTRTNFPLAERREVGALLLLCAQCNKRIEAFSTNELNNFSRSDILLNLKVPAGLSEKEWPAWRDSPEFPLFNHSHHCNVLTQRIRYLTGLSPVYLSRLNSYSALDFDAAMQAFHRAVGEGGTCNKLCGRWIVYWLRQYAQSVPPESRDQFVQQMLDACMGVPNENFDIMLFDPRFFYLDSDSHTICPVNGYIAQQQLQVLLDMESYRDRLIAKVDLNWARMACLNTNSVIRGFAFEFFYLCDFIRTHGLTVSRIVRYYGNYPAPCKLRWADEEMVLYWPIQWNPCSISFVTRQLVVRPAEDNNVVTHLFNALKRRKVTVPAVEITAYHMTLLPPLEHVHLLDFYHLSKPPADEHGQNQPDCVHFELPSDPEHRLHSFRWVVPASLADKTLPCVTLMKVNGRDTVLDQKLLSVVTL